MCHLASEEAKLPEKFVEDKEIKALSLGVPLVGMPQWTDQIPNSKFVQDVWKMGVRSKVGENVELRSRRSYLLFYGGGGGGMERGREGLLVSGLKAFAVLLLQALLASPATLIGFHRHLVSVTADLGSLVWPQ
uniref:Uncharacterized protein n=1 Tax=Quercus lobata TaxID=97700 RepID=A0A7N2KUI6_QUELO